MSVLYRPVGWNRFKLLYDVVVVALVLVYVLAFINLAPFLMNSRDAADGPIVRMRAFGSCAFLMLTFILSIGPLARLDRRFLPLLYNRRHFGVIACIVALTHALHVLGWYFAYSPTEPLVALLTSNTSFARVAGFPFELFGVVALMVMIILAATSHDFWLSFLTPPVWKAIHMALYGAYACVVVHVALGPLMATQNPALAILVTLCALGIATLHVLATRVSTERAAPSAMAGWRAAGPAVAVPEGRGIVVAFADAESVAIFRHNGALSAIANACAHQNGPLGEGRIIDGCVTCPWHGFQYRPEDGCAPPPFTEKLATYNLRIERGVVFIDPQPNAPGAYVAPVPVGDAA